MIVIGIDPGVKTGWAERWNGHITYTGTIKAIDLGLVFQSLKNTNPKDRFFIVEDARKRSGPAANAQGAGWVKVLSGQIEDYLKSMGFQYKMIAPIRNGTKLNAKMIKQITGYDKKTNEHERDAIMIAWSHK